MSNQPAPKPDLSLEVNFLGRTFTGPLVLASGIWGSTTSLLVRAAEQGCGAVTAKSCGTVPRPGHVNPSCIDWGAGLLNAIGLANPGAPAEAELLRAAKPRLSQLGSYLIASIFAGTPAEFGAVAGQVAAAKPDFIEVNISCPNVGSEFGEPFAADPTAAAEVTAAVKAAVSEKAVQNRAIPVIVKLAPNVPSVARIAQAVVEAGADALCAINTMPGLVLDAASGVPVLANRSGGISGPALKPIALKCVYDVRKACPEIPIIGTGGVTTGIDAVEMLMAGATVVGVGSAIHYRGPNALHAIRRELHSWMAEHGYGAVAELHDLAHGEPAFSDSPTSAPIPQAH